MFEPTLLAALTGDTNVTSYLSTYTDSLGSLPAIFSNSAPEKAEFMYLVFKINDIGNEDDFAIDIFEIIINLFGYSKSGVNERAAVRAIEKLLDMQVLKNDANYDYIRFKKQGSFFVEADDIRTQHYNIRFEARAGRSGWMSNL